MITVKYTSILRRDLGKDMEHVQAGSVAELLTELEQRYGEIFGLLPERCIFINGSSAALLEGRKTRLSDGDEVVFLLPVAGG